MKMKRLSIIAIIIASGFGVKAQQLPLYSNYYFTPYIYNPAASGTDGSTELTLLHRRQWADIQGSPETSALAINGSLNEEKVGWSVYGFRDVTDIISRVGVYGNYAYRLKLADNTVLSFGLGAGFVNNQIDQANIRARHEEAIITVTTDNRGNFDLSTGVNLEISEFTLGVSVPQLLAPSIEYTQNTTEPVNYSLIRHYVISTKYDFRFRGNDNVLTPLVMLKAAKNVPIQVDAGLIFNLKDYGYVGAMYRSEYAVTGNIGVNLTDQLTLGYAYDFSLNDYGPDMGTSHEFMLTYRFGSDKKTERIENEIKRLKQRQRQQQDEVEERVDERMEEVMDQIRRDIRKEAQEAAANNEQQADNQSGREAGTPANNVPASQRQGGQQPADQQPANQQPANQQTQTPVTPNQAYDPSNQANNVEPGSSGYYVVAGVFSSQQNAEKLVRNLSDKGISARYFQDQNNYYYYVYLLKFSNYNQADQAKASNLNGTYSGDLWIKIVE